MLTSDLSVIGSQVVHVKQKINDIKSYERLTAPFIKHVNVNIIFFHNTMSDVKLVRYIYVYIYIDFKDNI